MPIEIRELVIRARVEEQPSGQSGSSGPAAGGASTSSAQPDIQQIVAICAEEVMRLLKKQNER